MIKMFWRKLTLINIAVLMITLRLYSLFIAKIQKKLDNVSIFPSEDEYGYPFIEQIDCNLGSLYLVNQPLVNYSISRENIKLTNINQCDFMSKLLLCKNDELCYNNISSNIYETSYKNYQINKENYHKNTGYMGENLWEEIYNLNSYKENKENDNNEYELEFLYRIINGYETYIRLLLNKKDYEAIQDKVTYSYDRINDMFYLYSLLLKASLTYENKVFEGIVDYDANKTIGFYQYCLKNSEDEIPNLSEEFKQKTIENMNKIEKMINCISEKDAKYSSILDIRGLKSMLEILFNTKKIFRIQENEYKNLLYLTSNFINCIDDLFKAEYDIKYTNNKYKMIYDYGFMFFIGMGISVFLMMNAYFIKNRDKIDSKKRFIKNVKAENIRKEIKYQEALKKESERVKKEYREKNGIERGVPISQFTKEELEYVEKLTQNNGDFVVTK